MIVYFIQLAKYHTYLRSSNGQQFCCQKITLNLDYIILIILHAVLHVQGLPNFSIQKILDSSLRAILNCEMKFAASSYTRNIHFPCNFKAYRIRNRKHPFYTQTLWTPSPNQRWKNYKGSTRRTLPTQTSGQAEEVPDRGNDKGWNCK